MIYKCFHKSNVPMGNIPILLVGDEDLIKELKKKGFDQKHIKMF